MLVDGFTDMAVGLLPTFIVSITVFVLPSITETVLSPKLAT
jgi:hypothetical protein